MPISIRDGRKARGKGKVRQEKKEDARERGIREKQGIRDEQGMREKRSCGSDQVVDKRRKDQGELVRAPPRPSVKQKK